MVDEEETRAARLFVAGKITEEIWDRLQAEWNDRRQAISNATESTGVVINPKGNIQTELRAPLAYLKAINDQISGKGVNPNRQRKTRRVKAAGFFSQCSSYVYESWGTWTRTKIDGARTRCSAIELSPIG